MKKQITDPNYFDSEEHQEGCEQADEYWENQKDN